MDESCRKVTIDNKTTSTAHRLLHYDGACNHVHGHNMRWDVEVIVSMIDTGGDNMPVDFKDLDDLIDRYDHAILLNEDDPIAQLQELGETFTFNGDPTCELLAKDVAMDILVRFASVKHVKVTLAETDKYSITTTAGDEEYLEHV